MIPTLFPPTVTTTLGWQRPSMSGVAVVSMLLEISRRLSTSADIYCYDYLLQLISTAAVIYSGSPDHAGHGLVAEVGHEAAHPVIELVVTQRHRVEPEQVVKPGYNLQ